MKSQLLGEWFALAVFFSFVCSAKSGSKPLIQYVWPLTANTLNYEVIMDEDRSYLFGEQFVDGPFVGQRSFGAFELNGTTYVDIQMSDEFRSVFMVIAYFYLDSLEGDLFQYKDSDGTIVFRVWVESSGLSAEVYTSSPRNLLTVESVLGRNKWINIAFSRDQSNGKLEMGVNEHRVGSADIYGGKSFEKDFYLPTNGMLRLGNGVRGRVSCVVTSNVLDMKESTERLCTTTTDWKYSGPYGCMVSQCYHGARCTDDKTIKATCDCVGGYTGQFCQEEINECEAMPCANSQPCKDKLNGYLCECGSDYTGTLCETELSKHWDEGYYRLEKTGYGPNETLSVSTTSTGNTRRCGQRCVQYPGCLSFTVRKIKKEDLSCVLYTMVYDADVIVPDVRYYIPKYFTKS